MSADNGIYMLETSGNEFRVGHLQNIEEIYVNFDPESQKFRLRALYSLFLSCEIFYNHEQALDYAKFLLGENNHMVEYGICYLAATNIDFPESLPDCCNNPLIIDSYGCDGAVDIQECHNCGYSEILENVEDVEDTEEL